MRLRTLALSLAATAAMGLGAAAQAATITFDELAHDAPVGYEVYHSVTSGGFLFANDGTGQVHNNNELVVWARGNASNADPDGATLANNFPRSITTVTKIGGGVFTLGAIDLANGLNSGGGGTVLFTFYTPDVGVGAFSVETELVTLGVDPGLKTVIFNRTGLTSFSYEQQNGALFVQVDNVVVDQFATNAGVPEPGAWALLILGFGAAGSMLRRGRAMAT
ncbi:MAG: PEPxxWA-CTERM sorting domain-containing protein [Phenylobacterium sp.]|uniref:PEPxxWA-CTERM sorting domain-containing protein n=1 Tax=Phenylobacterium sp. TaxID=1871053 RepID=UPI001A563442|nr:PEPxxWA-CTERM sorting domain-containing protein [Phenylobacterium sp.]MBL8555665.1 PEPxxWA-CTERM sorting domain-containing protein [Phenylobacterium sp.]